MYTFATSLSFIQLSCKLTLRVLSSQSRTFFFIIIVSLLEATYSHYYFEVGFISCFYGVIIQENAPGLYSFLLYLLLIRNNTRLRSETKSPPSVGVPVGVVVKSLH